MTTVFQNLFPPIHVQTVCSSSQALCLENQLIGLAFNRWPFPPLVESFYSPTTLLPTLSTSDTSSSPFDPLAFRNQSANLSLVRPTTKQFRSSDDWKTSMEVRANQRHPTQRENRRKSSSSDRSLQRKLQEKQREFSISQRLPTFQITSFVKRLWVSSLLIRRCRI